MVSKFSKVIVSLGFVASQHDSTLFVRKTNVGHIFLSLYIDDMIITGDDFDGIASIKTALSHHFAMKYLCVLRYFLGIEVASSSKGYLHLSPSILLTYLSILGLLTTRLLILILRQVYDILHRMVFL